MQQVRFIRKAQEKTALDAWQESIAQQTHRNPNLKHQLLQQQGELLPRFANHYDRLKGLPRCMRRNLQRKWKQSLAGVALLLALGQTPALAATINVGGGCTLVEAIQSANMNRSVGGCRAGSGADRIVLPANSTQTLTTVNSFGYGRSGLPVIHSVITIDGNGSTIRRAPTAPDFRIFAVARTGDLTLQQTRVSGGAGGGIYNAGSLRVTNSVISGNSGGGVYSDDFSVVTVITNSTISGNTAFRGGGVYVYNNGGNLRVTNSVISGNFSQSEGGGLCSYDAGLMVTNSTISNNRALGAGGGVSWENGGAVITDSTISGNSAAQSGGGVHNDTGMRLTNSTISGNTADSRGGGVFNTRGYDASLLITNSTISGNSAAQSGGGVFNFDQVVHLIRTLISGNTAPSGSELYNYSGRYGSGAVIAANFDLFGHSGLTNAQAFANFTPGVTDITATSNGNRPSALAGILNTTLANNGGPTRTHALVAGSPAIDSVNNGTCPPPARDQRGVARPRDGNGDGGVACDTGSFER